MCVFYSWFYAVYSPVLVFFFSLTLSIVLSFFLSLYVSTFIILLFNFTCNIFFPTLSFLLFFSRIYSGCCFYQVSFSTPIKERQAREEQRGREEKRGIERVVSLNHHIISPLPCTSPHLHSSHPPIDSQTLQHKNNT